VTASTDLPTFCDWMLKNAKEEHQRAGQTAPTIAVLGRTGRVAVYKMRHRPDASLRMHSPAIIGMLREIDGWALVFYTECWTSEITMKNRPGIHVDDIPRPREMPDRGEAVRVLAITEDGEYRAQLSMIRRGAFGSSFEDGPVVTQLPGGEAWGGSTSEWFTQLLAAK